MKAKLVAGDTVVVKLSERKARDRNLHGFVKGEIIATNKKNTWYGIDTECGEHIHVDNKGVEGIFTLAQDYFYDSNARAIVIKYVGPNK